MMKTWKPFGVILLALSLTACGFAGEADDPLVVTSDGGQGPTPDAGSPDAESDPVPSGLAVLGDGQDSLEAVEVTTAVGPSARLNGPRDLEFNPEATRQLWIVNRNDHSTVVVSNLGTDAQSSTKYDGPGSSHFLAKPAALAFGKPGFMATAQQTDEKTQLSTPPDFMGITLWTTNLAEFNAGHRSHYDMLHNSPNASGIAWEAKNIYWVFDGYHGSITRYNFKSDHGGGGRDHSDGVVRRYLDGQLGIKEGVVAHVALDRETGLLYAADTANNRIVELDTSTGELDGAISPNYDGSDQMFVSGAESRTLVDGESVGLERPAGLELHNGFLFVSDNATSTIHAFTLEGEPIDRLDLSERIPDGQTQGMTFDQKGRLYVANGQDDEILKVAPKSQSAGE